MKSLQEIEDLAVNNPDLAYNQLYEREKYYEAKEGADAVESTYDCIDYWQNQEDIIGYCEAQQEALKYHF